MPILRPFYDTRHSARMVTGYRAAFLMEQQFLDMFPPLETATRQPLYLLRARLLSQFSAPSRGDRSIIACGRSYRVQLPLDNTQSVGDIRHAAASFQSETARACNSHQRPRRVSYKAVLRSYWFHRVRDGLTISQVRFGDAVG
jgi:hypothetical protein